MAALDHLDIKIMRILADNGRISISDLAEQVGLSQTPTAKRIRRLEQNELITGYQAILNESRLGGSMTVFTWVSLTDQNRESLDAFEESMAKLPEVMDCYLMTGDADYLIRIAVDGLDEFERFLTERVSRSDKVSSIRSSVALRPVVLKRRPPSLTR